MKKIGLVLLLAIVLCIPGCGGKEKAGTSNTKEVDKYASKLKESVGEGVSLPSESVTKVLAKTWNVVGGEDVYVMETDGTGSKNDETFTFESGFDDENHITLKIKMDESEKEELYSISTDTTGYGINLASLSGGKDLYLFPADLEVLQMSDERAAGMIGEWADESGNKYTFDKNGKMKIAGSKSDSEGTYSIVENAEGTLLLNIVVSGGSLEYAYTLDKENTVMELCSPGTETVHQWTKQ